MKIAMQPRPRLRLSILSKALAQHKPDEDGEPADGNVRDVGQESRAQGERCNSLEENPSIEIALPEKNPSPHPAQMIPNKRNRIRSLEATYASAVPYSEAVMQQIVMPLQAEYPQCDAVLIVDPWMW
jgi:hypothetical protein